MTIDANSRRAFRHYTGSSTPLMLVSLALLVLVLAAAFNSASAAAKQVRVVEETFGSAAQPSFDSVAGMAVDYSSGDLLVIDAGADTVSRYNPDGTPHNFPALGTNVIDAKGSGNCATVPADCDQTPQNGLAFDASGTDSQVAVDNSGTATDGNIYVTQAHLDLIDVFAADGHYLGQLTKAGTTTFNDSCGVTVDASGAVYVGTFGNGKVFKFVPSANPPLNTDHTTSSQGFINVCGVAAGAGPSAGSLFLTRFTQSVSKLDIASGALQYVVHPSSSITVSVNSINGHAFVAGFSGEISEYDASGPAATLISTTPATTTGLASTGASDRLYVASGTDIDVYGPPVPLPDVVTSPAAITDLDSATLKGTVNPNGVTVDECFFEWGSTKTYGEISPCAESSAQIGTGAAPVSVYANIAGLATEGVVYHYRLVAKNVNGTAEGSDRAFTTPDEPVIGDTWVQEVVFSQATLKAEINPKNTATTYRFEWGPDTSYGNSTPEISLGSGDTDQTIGFTLGGLDPDTTYHYRVVATNTLGTIESQDRTFITYALPDPPNTGCPNQAFRADLPSAHLPDCRAYEMVTPLDKGGGGIETLTTIGNPGTSFRDLEARLRQAAPDGSALTYSSYRAFADPEAAPWNSQYLSRRDPVAGWETESISQLRSSFSFVTPGILDDTSFTSFTSFTADLCTGFLRQDSDVPLAPGDQVGYLDLYRSHHCGPAEDSYDLLTSAAPQTQPPEIGPPYFPRMQGFSTDGSRVVLHANDKLATSGTQASNATEEGNPIWQLYLNTGSTLRLVSVEPNGAAAGSSSSVGTLRSSIKRDFRSDTLAGAVSADGTRVFWSSPVKFFGANSARLYLRLNADRAQSPLSEGQCTQPDRACTQAVSESVSADPAQFLSATADGSEALFRFTGGAHSGELYSYDVSRALAGEDPETLIAPGVQGILGASEDLSRVYLVSTAALGAGAVAGQPNLYMYEQGGGHRFIATLLGAPISFDELSYQERPYNHVSRVSPDGGHAAFVSNASLTGYDNLDAGGSGRAVGEVFLYDVEANGGAGKLLCVSCKPSGARPEASSLATPNVPPDHPSRYWTASHLPGWENSLYAPRVLSDDGSHLFFDSFDALLPADANGMQDVYQWEAPDSEDCEVDDANYFEANGGCLSLISSGKSPQNSSFVDASTDGTDILLTTGERLHGADIDTLTDIYDARAGGGFPSPAPSPPPCEGDACRGGGSAAAETTGAGSAAFVGPDDPPPAFEKSCPKGKRKALRRGKPRCVPKRPKRKRAAGERRRANR